MVEILILMMFLNVGNAEVINIADMVNNVDAVHFVDAITNSSFC